MQTASAPKTTEGYRDSLGRTLGRRGLALALFLVGCSPVERACGPLRPAEERDD
jgi:hypothetical protein